MIKHYCDICGKEMKSNEVINDTDPLDYYYGECSIEFGIPLSGYYSVGFGEICHECARKIKNITIKDFQKFFIEEFLK